MAAKSDKEQLEEMVESEQIILKAFDDIGVERPDDVPSPPIYSLRSRSFLHRTHALRPCRGSLEGFHLFSPPSRLLSFPSPFEL
eukprot:2599498-Rhodomonas_salina.2